MSYRQDLRAIRCSIGTIPKALKTFRRGYLGLRQCNGGPRNSTRDRLAPQRTYMLLESCRLKLYADVESFSALGEYTPILGLYYDAAWAELAQLYYEYVGVLVDALNDPCVAQAWEAEHGP